MHCSECAAARAQYTCPSCNTTYCTSVCYGRHNGGACSEAFYRAQVQQGTPLLDHQGSDTRSKTLSLLLKSRHHLDGEGDGSSPLDSLVTGGRGGDSRQPTPPVGEGWESLDTALAAKLSTLALAVDAAPDATQRGRAMQALEDALDGPTRAVFLRAVVAEARVEKEEEEGGRDGEGGQEGDQESTVTAGDGGNSRIGIFPQWWEEGSPTPRPFTLCVPMGEGEGGGGAECGGGGNGSVSSGIHPPLYRPPRPPLPPPLSTLRPSGPPSPTLPYCILTALYAYCHTMVLYGGDIDTDTPPSSCTGNNPAAAATLLQLSPPLLRDVRYGSVAEACRGALECGNGVGVRLTPLPSPAHTLAVLREGVALGVLSSPGHALDALLHAWVCVKGGCGGGGCVGGVEGRKALEKGAAKLWFYASWARGVGEGEVRALQHAVLKVCEEGMGALLGEKGRGGRGESEGNPSITPPSSLSDLLAGRLVLRRDTLRQFPALLKVKQDAF